MDVSAVILNKLLSERSLDIWAKLKLVFLDPSYSSLYSVINKHYEKYSALPSFDDLELTIREGPASKTLATLRLTEVPEVSAEIALDALIDQYTQSETIKLLEKFVDKLPLYDTDEIKEELSTIAMTIEEKTHTSEKVFNMSELMAFQHQEDIAAEHVYLGLNNTFDAVLGGNALEETVLIGGKRGAGKSIVCSNLLINQYEMGNTSVYFTIEMKAFETYQRNMSILANVSHERFKKGTLTDAEVLAVVNARAGMFEGSEGIVSEFMKDRDKFKFEQTLVRDCSLKRDNQMIIVDDQSLTIGRIDLHLGKLKARFGDKLKVGVIDYINQIKTEGASQYDWQPQIDISTKIKGLARKYEMVLVSPYQIDATGEARFAKGILDSADIGLILEAHAKEEQAITFQTTKIRGATDMKFTSPINWETLRISPVSIDAPAAPEKMKRAGKKDAKTDEDATDLPWREE